MLKRFFAISLALLMIFSIVGCGKTNESLDSVTSSEEEIGGFTVDTDTTSDGASSQQSGNSSKKPGNTSVVDKVTDVTNKEDANIYTGRATDLKGKVVKVHGWGTGVCTTSGSGIIAQRAKTLIQSIEKTLNCTIVISSGVSQYDESVIASLASGKPKYDIIWLSEGYLVSNVIYNRIVPLDDLKVINFKDHERYTAATELAKFGGKYYGVAPKTYGYVPFMVNSALFANLNILKKAGITEADLQKWVKNNQWTWDKFLEVGSKVKASNSTLIYDKMDNGGRFSDFYQGLLTSNGTDWIKQTSEGKYSFAGNTKPATEALDYIKKLYDNGYLKLSSKSAESDFIAGNSAFTIQPLYAPNYNNAATTYGNFTILPLPIGPSASEYRIASSDYTFAAIARGTKPSGATDAEIATVLDLLQSNMLTAAENDTLILTETIAMAKNSLATDTINRYKNLHNSGKENLIWSHLVLSNANGIVWPEDVYNYVSGTKGKAEIMAQADTYNNILKNFAVKK
ncbi:MAG: extracellular solute-binding protein [Clostridia bacterium]|nr:extracellular solute-binding protein [Clostridia bacterium]